MTQESTSPVTTDLPFAWGGPALRGHMRVSPQDFFVDEQIGFSATGAGEHWLLQVEKISANTAWAVKRLAVFAGLAERDIGFAGMKDRHAVTRQYFSVPARKGQNLDWSRFSEPDVRIISAERHARKLQRGALSGNQFVLVIRDVVGDREQAERVLETIRLQGVPNYFGEQRFGRGGGNVDKARALFSGRRFERKERSIILSAARSELFNAVLAVRVSSRNWNQAMRGDVFQLEGRSAIFGPEALDEALIARVQSGDIHPTGPLWGDGSLRSTELVAQIEQATVSTCADLAEGLVREGLSQERRALRILARDLQWSWPDTQTLEVRFGLPAGAYATSTLREVVDFSAML